MMNRVLLIGVGVSLLVAGCGRPGARRDTPPGEYPYENTDLDSNFAHMADNALLADMTVCDMHFYPHRAMLNSLGKQRLNRLALLMDAYGGTIRFDTALTSADLIDKRIAAVMDFLAEAGVDTTREVLVRDMSGGEGMPATEAILIKAEEGTFKPKEGASSGGDEVSTVQ